MKAIFHVVTVLFVKAFRMFTCGFSMQNFGLCKKNLISSHVNITRRYCKICDGQLEM